MKDGNKLLAMLDRLWAEERTALNEHTVRSEPRENRGYGKSPLEISKAAADEMHHAEWLVEQRTFLEGAPTVSIRIGKIVSVMTNNDNTAEVDLVRSYVDAVRSCSDAIKLARAVDEEGTLDLLSKILEMEERHVNLARVQLAGFDQMDMENDLPDQKRAATG